MIAGSIGFASAALAWALPAAAVQRMASTECRPTPTEDLLPGIAGPLTGEAPIWVIDGSVGIWRGPNPTKTLWVIDRGMGSEELIVSGHRLGDGTSLRFQSGPGMAPTERFTVSRPGDRSVIPGAATAEGLRRYAFLPSYALYAGPGCWEMTARLGDVERRIIVEQTAPADARDPPSAR